LVSDPEEIMNFLIIPKTVRVMSALAFFKAAA